MLINIYFYNSFKYPIKFFTKTDKGNCYKIKQMLMSIQNFIQNFKTGYLIFIDTTLKLST